MGSGPELQETLSTILAICRKMNSERDLGALLDLIAREATALLDADRASIFLLDREKNELWSKVALGSPEELRFDARLGVAGHAVTTGETVNVTDARRDPRFYGDIDDHTGYRTRTLLAVALRNHRDEIVGAFEVLNKREGIFTADDQRMLEALATHAAIAIETALLIERMKQCQEDLAQQNASLWREVELRSSTHGIVGTSAKIQAVVQLIERIHDSLVNVLVTGESGTGKELAARALHFTSPRARRPFVALNCAALPEQLVESELFGIEKGVATGVQPRIGHFQAAGGGTLFLDEIGDLSLTAQAKILRALEERVIERVGGRTSISIDVRVIAATNKDLEAEIAKGAFREDLYYRLKVIHIHMPALREIPGDIPLLAIHFLRDYCREAGRDGLELSPALLRRLAASPWPGNARQLRNEIARLAACARGGVIGEEDLLEGRPEAPAPRTGGSLKDAIAEIEKRMIVDTLRATSFNQQQTARLLGISRQGLINKIKRYRIVN